ncbi:tumor necrosis factor-like [Cololabis saira]|uniref:tumor necrosis factor-like n=1 Tax=Cololabis saira TaxID=129043 RepID=UPI002AD2C716|nr:tumor necrosis factor-like [Cololabis saira]
MGGYAAAPADLELGIQETVQALGEKRSPAGWMWKVLGAVLAAALCLGGLQLWALYWAPRPQTTAQAEERKAPTLGDPAGSTDPHHMLKQFSSNAKAAIHLVGTYDEDESAQLEWSASQGQGFTYGSFQLRQNRIVVPRGGLYFVYSQASFRVTCGGEAGAGGPPVPPSHRIWRLSDSIGSKVSLLSAVRSVCQPGGAAGDGELGWYNTIYLGAVFQLNRGDELWTETNLLPELETDEGKTFFGVFAL